MSQAKLIAVKKTSRGHGRRKKDQVIPWLKQLTLWCLLTIGALTSVYEQGIKAYILWYDKWQEAKAHTTEHRPRDAK